MNVDSLIRDANKLICEYNRRDSNVKKLVLCSKNNIYSWLSISERIKKDIRGTELERLFMSRFMHGKSYVKVSHENHISETTFYTKLKNIYDTAINYMYYERLFIIADSYVATGLEM